MKTMAGRWASVFLSLALVVLASALIACSTPATTPIPTATPLSPTPTPFAATPTPPVTSIPVTTPVTTTFDFDTGSPALFPGQNTPFDQTSAGITAHFSSPSDPGTFSIQSQNTTFYTLSQFSGNYLFDNDPFVNSLVIGFNRELTSITITFATTDSHGPGNVEEPSNIRLTAYMDSTGTTPVESVTAQGSFSSDSFPQGTLSFNPGGQPFNLVVIEILVQPLSGGTNLFVDNIQTTTS